MADRIQRIQSVIGKNISTIIQFEVKNPRIGFCVVNEVVVTRDFSLAKVYVSFLGAKYPNQNLEELNKVKGYIRSSLAKKLDIRKTPAIEFYLDETISKTERLDKILKKEQDDLDKLKTNNSFSHHKMAFLNENINILFL